MRFESGMLGFLIIVLAIGGAIAGTILLSAEEQTYDVTRYELVTDVTGLFDTDESPQYMDYDLAKNYTGYYTVNTIYGGVPYWGGATFTDTGVNNYPIRYYPEVRTEGQYDLLTKIDDYTPSDPPNGNTSVTHFEVEYYDSDYNGRYGLAFMGHSVMLSSVIEELGLDGYDIIVINTTQDSDEDTHVYFSSTDEYTQVRDGLYRLKAVNRTVYSTYPEGNGYWIACMSCKINTITGTVDYYYTNTTNNMSYVRSVSLSEATVCMYPYYNYDYSSNDIVNITAYNSQDTDYMDISRGVTVTGVTT